MIHFAPFLFLIYERSQSIFIPYALPFGLTGSFIGSNICSTSQYWFRTQRLTKNALLQYFDCYK